MPIFEIFHTELSKFPRGGLDHTYKTSFNFRHSYRSSIYRVHWLTLSVSTLQEISYLQEILPQKGKIQDEGNSQEISFSYPEPAIFRRRIESSGIIHNRKPEILAFLLDCYIPFCINNQSDSPRFMDYPRALDSSPEDRGLGVRD